ncbi:MAG TPA: hypothetical protein VKE24_11440 [Candidatus Acidoferrales bacterium]|nr:hypothetical protein [Candidatus Acidoferrales bacterium]
MLFRVAPTLLLFLSVPPLRAQSDPASWPAREAHEGLLIAADPYQDAARSKTRFGKKTPYEAGIVAIEVFLRNDNLQAIHVDLESIRLLVAPGRSQRQRLEPLAIEDVVDRILNKGGPNPTLTRRPLPRREPKPGRSKEWKEVEAALRFSALETDVIPPRGTARGFLFFDLDHHYDWVSEARLYLPDLRFIENQKPLLFFELDLAGTRSQ